VRNGWHVLGCDLRALALFRIALSLTLLADLAARAGDLKAHYTDAGILPRGMLAGTAESVTFSLHALSGGSLFEAFLFALAAVAAALMGIGYRTRWMTCAGWIFLVSLQARNPLILNQGDHLLVALLLLAIFLPLGARYSVDAALDPGPAHGNRFLSMATAALLIQVTLVYFIAALRAFAGSAEFGAASVPAEVLEYLGLAAPLLAFSPIMHAPLRLLLIVGLIGAQVMGSLALGLGSAAVAGCVALLAFMPSSVWDRLAQWAASAEREGLRVYFDRDCGFCHKTCLLFRTLLVLGDIPITPAQDAAAVYAMMQQHNSWVVYDHDNTPYVRWHAVLLLLRRSPIFWPLGRLLTAIGMGRWGDGFYETIALNRFRLSKLTAVLLPYRPTPVHTGAAVTALVGLWLLFALAGNVLSLVSERPEKATAMAAVRHALGLDQNWHLLQADTLALTTSYEFTGQLRDGTTVRIDDQSNPDGGEPVYVQMARVVHGERWRQYLATLSRSSATDDTERFARWVCDVWAGQEPEQDLRNFVLRARGRNTASETAPSGGAAILITGSCQ